MPAREFARWKQKTILSAGLKVLAPTGQYSSEKVVNWVYQSMGFQAGTGLFGTLGKLAARCLCGSLALYDQLGIFCDPAAQIPS